MRVLTCADFFKVISNTRTSYLLPHRTQNNRSEIQQIYFTQEQHSAYDQMSLQILSAYQILIIAKRDRSNVPIAISDIQAEWSTRIFRAEHVVVMILTKNSNEKTLLNEIVFRILEKKIVERFLDIQKKRHPNLAKSAHLAICGGVFTELIISITLRMN